jgi:uracil phosphoribosyltransferase
LFPGLRIWYDVDGVPWLAAVSREGGLRDRHPLPRIGDEMTTTAEIATRSGSTVCVDHPLVRHCLTTLRDESTPPDEFRQLVRRLAVLLAYEATKDLTERAAEVRTPLCTTTGTRLDQRIGLVPILRAGLGMVDPVLELIPQAEVWHLGIYRDERTMQPVEYYSRLPSSAPVDVALVLDPMLATGGSVLAALTTLRDWGVPVVKVISIIGSADGVREVECQFPSAGLFVAAIDPELNEHKYIVPGLGDAGDRAFNTLPKK